MLPGFESHSSRSEIAPIGHRSRHFDECPRQESDLRHPVWEPVSSTSSLLIGLRPSPGGSDRMPSYPCPYRRTLPYAPSCKFDLRSWEVVIVSRKLGHALFAHAEHLGNLS